MAAIQVLMAPCHRVLVVSVVNRIATIVLLITKKDIVIVQKMQTISLGNNNR